MRETSRFFPNPGEGMPSTTRTPLSRDGIIQTAIEYVDAHGLGALTMRQLGQLLGVEAMSLYHHVNGREDLLEGIVDTLVSAVEVPPLEPLGPVDGWQAFLQHVAHAVRSIAVDHPNLFPLVATRPPAAPWLRPPLRSLALVEDFLNGLIARDVPEDAVVYVYKQFTSFLLGHLLLDVAERGAETGPPEEPLDEGAAPVPNQDQTQPLRPYATVLRLEDRLRTHDPEAEFEGALEALLDRLDRDLSQ
jgi:TetR/AcrR family transcriptional regulator, tetracycline repressor protein